MKEKLTEMIDKLEPAARQVTEEGVRAVVLEGYGYIMGAVFCFLVSAFLCGMAIWFARARKRLKQDSPCYNTENEEMGMWLGGIFSLVFLFCTALCVFRALSYIIFPAFHLAKEIIG